MQKCAELVVFLIKKYNISQEAVLRHYDITGKYCPAYLHSGRLKTTPTPSFDAYWTTLKRLISERLSQGGS